MSRAQALLRALQRLPAAGAGFGEASLSLKAAFCSGSLLDATRDALPGVSKSVYSFNPRFKGPMSFSFASQMHTLPQKEDDNRTKSAALSMPQLAVGTAPKGLIALPPKPRMTSLSPATAARRALATAAHSAHLESNQSHPYHILPDSPWPWASCQATLTTMLGMCLWFHAIPHGGMIMFSGLGTLLVTATGWWRDCLIESDMGMHTEAQRQNLINGIWIFIASEAALFFGLLWSCVHLGMSPNVALQMQWPPVGIEAIGWEGRAMVMSAVLAASYYSANVAVVAKNPKVVMGALATTVGLGGLFLADQYLEYSTAPFTLTDGPYGTTFFMTTGFHGFHVLVGSVWLLAALANYARFPQNTVTLQGAVLYWHFVDIVWIAVYGIIYCAQL